MRDNRKKTHSFWMSTNFWIWFFFTLLMRQFLTSNYFSSYSIAVIPFEYIESTKYMIKMCIIYKRNRISIKNNNEHEHEHPWMLQLIRNSRAILLNKRKTTLKIHTNLVVQSNAVHFKAQANKYTVTFPIEMMTKKFFRFFLLLV